MKFYFYAIIIFTIALKNCSKKENASQIAKFEETLGKENSETLTYLVNDFESDFLKKKYPSLSRKKAYEKFLSTIGPNGKNIYYDMISEDSRKKFEGSQLKNEIYTYSDSVWIEDGWVHARHIYNSDQGKIELGMSQSSYNKTIGQDSILKLHKSFFDFNTRGKYLKAIESVKGTNPFLGEYFQVKNRVGNIAEIIVPYQLNRHYIDFSSYFIRRIIVLELAY